MRKTNNENRHSDELQEIISAPPSWLIRWGVVLFVTVLVIAAALARLIEIPETCTSRIVISQAPKKKSKALQGIVYLPQSKMLEIKPGSLVLIRLDAYPEKEFGIITGVTLASEKPLLIKNEFQLSVQLKKDYSQRIHLLDGLSGTARIIQKKVSLWEKIASGIAESWKIKH